MLTYLARFLDPPFAACSAVRYSADFAARWIAGFVGWPSADNPYWINDRPNARTPWVSDPEFRDVDEILAAEIPDSLACRRLPAEYARLYVEGEARPTDVSYISYVESKRTAPAKAADQVPTDFIFEYDDRISAERWAKVITAEDIEQGIACRLTTSAGFRRSFCLRSDAGFTAPALVKDAAGARDVNGVLYAAPNSWDPNGPDPFCGDRLSRVEVSREDIHILANFMCLPADAKVYTYVVEKPLAPDYDHPIRQSILDVILAGCLEHSVGADFCAEWVDTTDGWKNANGKTYWINDRVIARRPWIALGGSYKIFDRVVFESTSPIVPAGILLERRLEEEYVLNKVQC